MELISDATACASLVFPVNIIITTSHNFCAIEARALAGVIMHLFGYLIFTLQETTKICCLPKAIVIQNDQLKRDP